MLREALTIPDARVLAMIDDEFGLSLPGDVAVLRAGTAALGSWGGAPVSAPSVAPANAVAR